MDMISKINTKIGNYVALLNPVLILLIMVDIILRYLFQFTKIWIVELEWHIFALIFLLSGAYTLLNDRHVRVDVFYNSWDERKKSIINILGHFILLIPWTLSVCYSAYYYAQRSFLINESSPDPAGLAFRFLIKSAIFVSFGLLLLQGISEIIKGIRTLRNS